MLIHPCQKRHSKLPKPNVPSHDDKIKKKLSRMPFAFDLYNHIIFKQQQQKTTLITL